MTFEWTFGWDSLLLIYDLAKCKYYINLAMDPSVSSASGSGDQSCTVPSRLGVTAQYRWELGTLKQMMIVLSRQHRYHDLLLDRSFLELVDILSKSMEYQAGMTVIQEYS